MNHIIPNSLYNNKLTHNNTHQKILMVIAEVGECGLLPHVCPGPVQLKGEVL